MGGLKRKETTITEKKVPLLGDLPLVGFFFTNSKTQIKNTELLVFISPHIHKGEPIPDGAMAKFRETKSKSQWINARTRLSVRCGSLWEQFCQIGSRCRQGGMCCLLWRCWMLQRNRIRKGAWLKSRICRASITAKVPIYSGGIGYG